MLEALLFFFKDSIAPNDVQIINVIPGNLSYVNFIAFDKKYLVIAFYGPNKDDPDFYR